jgi:hypothetical protein
MCGWQGVELPHVNGHGSSLGERFDLYRGESSMSCCKSTSTSSESFDYGGGGSDLLESNGSDERPDNQRWPSGRVGRRATSKLDGLVNAEGGGHRGGAVPAGMGFWPQELLRREVEDDPDVWVPHFSEMRKRAKKGKLVHTRIHSLHYTCKWASYCIRRT